MTAIFRTTKELWLAALCLLLLLSQFYPVTTEWVFPVLDFKGGSQYNMETDHAAYHCGEMVQARFKFQKQRAISGHIKWQLVSHDPERHIVLYPSRIAASPILIIDHWANVEKLPNYCDPGRYHFEGTITYPMLFGEVSYDLKTQTFEVMP